MSGLLAALNSGKTGLFTNQKLVEIAGNNITNANTPGYSRQEAVIGSLPALELNGFFVGRGVNVDDIVREHDVFLTKQLQSKNSSFGEESGKTNALAELEQIFNISDQNLATEIDMFFDAWQELSANPGGQVERDLVIQRGNALSQNFLDVAQELDSIQQDINSSISSKIDSINLKLEEVADLNRHIADQEATGVTANSFRDSRDLLIKELSFSLGIKSYEESNGMITITLPGGYPLVQFDEPLTLNAVSTGSDLELSIQYNNTSLDISQNNLGGEFKGLLTIKNEVIVDLENDLDSMAYDLVAAINTQHQAGVGLDNVSHLFFNTLATETEARHNISVAITDSNEVAAGSTSAPGDNTNALLISALRGEKIIGATDTLADAYGKLSSSVGIEAGRNNLALIGNEDAITQLENLNAGRVGVSIEEEMINLIQYQAAFEAASKFLAIVDEMMLSLLNLKR